MKRKYLLPVAMLTAGLLAGCNEDEWLERTPKDRLTDEQVWNDPNMILGVLANYYDRLPQLAGVFNTGASAEFDDAMWSGHTDQNSHNDLAYGDSYGRYWDYDFLRDINLSLENIAQHGGNLTDEQKKQFNAELRFIRAYVYFELVKRMGGVPLVTTQLIYEGGGDPTPLQVPRAKESDVYDFIYDELEAIKDNFNATEGSRTRANKYAALALQSRAMLYAGSIAKYNALMGAPIATPGGEVGIPDSKANDYYQKSLTASQAIIANTEYELYNPSSGSKGDDYYKLFMDKSAKEIIFAKDFATGKVHSFTYDNVVKSFRVDIEGSSMLAPSLSLVESFDYLDGSSGALKDKDTAGNYVAYEKPEEIFAGKDARLYGTVVYAGSLFRGEPVDIQAGVAVWNEAEGKYSLHTGELGSTYDDGKPLTGFDGPKNDYQYVSNTGFYIRKFVSENPQDGVRPSLASNWWPWFRLGEVYLNAAEAAFELNGGGANYVNELREKHGGFPANSIANLTVDVIRNERRVELAFEDHRYFDLKRWRIADQVWNGQEADPTAVVHGLYPYRVIRAGHADDGKYIFDRVRPNRFRRARYFRMANYYSSIATAVLTNNPKIVKNPFH